MTRPTPREEPRKLSSLEWWSLGLRSLLEPQTCVRMPTLGGRTDGWPAGGSVGRLAPHLPILFARPREEQGVVLVRQELL